MGAEKLYTDITKMGGPLRTGVCVALWVMVVTRVGAQAGDNLQASDSPPGPPLPLEGIRRFVNGHTSTSVDARTTMLTRMTNAGLESIGGRVEENQNNTKWLYNGHSYYLEDDDEPRARTSPANVHTGRPLRRWEGEATREGPRHPLADFEDVAGEEQVSGTSVDQAGDLSPDTTLNGLGENKSAPVPDVDSADWSRESSQWTYQEGEWAVVHLPDSAYPSLPAPPSLAAALVMVTNNMVEVERDVSGLANVTLHYRFYLSKTHDPATKPELKVYHVVDGMRDLLQEETVRGEWLSRTLDVPEADVSSIVFEGQPKGDDDLIAVSNVDTTGVTLNEGEPLDMDDQFTFPISHSNTTDTLPSTPTTEGNQTQEVSPQTDTEDQDNSTATSVPPADTQIDLSLNSTVSMSQSPAEEEVAADNVTETPINSSELKASTDSPQNETQASEQLNESMDVIALNSSTTGSDNITWGDGEADFSNSTTTTDEEESEADEGESTTTSVMDDEAGTSEAVLGTDESTNNSSILSIPGLTTDSLQANTSVASPTGESHLINNGSYGNLNTPSGPPTRIELTDEGEAISKNVFGGDELTSGTTLEAPQSNGTSGNVTSPSDVTISLEGKATESTPLPSPAGNNTEAVTAVPDSSTSWQVFQVFLVLCVMGLLALGFLYWRRKRRQDDEIPVFTRHTDYHNPTFSMEDAANFVSRTGRNTYKTIE